MAVGTAHENLNLAHEIYASTEHLTPPHVVPIMMSLFERWRSYDVRHIAPPLGSGERASI
jgi:hypothetical protein